MGSAAGSDGVFTTHVATQVFGPCPENEAFRVGFGASLPDCRAYEQASSPDKNGDSVAGLYPLMLASEDGSGVTFYSPAGALPPAVRGGTQNYPTYLATRNATAGSWSSQRLLPPSQFGEEAEFLGASPDLRYSVVEASYVGVGSALFVIDTEDGTVKQITPYESGGKLNVKFAFDGAATDGSRIFFETELTLPTSPADPAPAPGRENLYMWERGTGNVSLVGILPGSTPEAPADGSFGGAYEWYETPDLTTGGASNHGGGEFSPNAVAALNAISPDGRQIYFTAGGTGQLYLRRGLGPGENPTTVRVSAPAAGAPVEAEKPAAFQEATPDGRFAFFFSSRMLTSNANGTDLYRWDAQTGSLVDITHHPGGEGAEVQGLLGVSASGNSGYLIARGKLATGGKEGGENLYRFSEEETAGHFHIAFIATLAKSNAQEADRRNLSPKVTFGFQLGRTSRVSEDGGTLLFTSTKSLTGYDNVNAEGTDCNGGACAEIYRYSASTEELTCLSCDPTGQAPLGAASLQDFFFNAYLTPRAAPAVAFSRNLSADGTRVFFQTPDPLVANDTNGTATCPPFGGSPGGYTGPARCQDVYEWEAVGSGSCHAVEANGGCLYLLSTGQSDEPSYFIGASKDGSSAFIATASRLVPSDRDNVDDVYDVRVGGGLESQFANPPVPCTSSEACKGPTSAPAPAASPATPSFQGPGNQKSTECRKGYVAKKGKCVRAKHKKTKKNKKTKRKSKKPKGRTKQKRNTSKKHSGGAK